MINYDSLKQYAETLRRQGVRVKVSDLVTLAPKNDPFYAGAPAQVRDGEWFANLFHQLGIAGGDVHLRRVHYRILDLPEHERRLPITISTGQGADKIELTYYQNYQRCWDYLTEAAKSARYLDLVPINAFVDNRAKEATFSFYSQWSNPGDEYYQDPTPGYQIQTNEWYAPWEGEVPELPYLSNLPDLDSPPYYETTGYTVQQPYHLEIWVEKSEGEDVFLPLCERYGANFVPGVGDMSISTTFRFAQRVRQAQRPAKLLYIADFDPSGFNMPVAVARKLEHFCRNYGFDDLDITLEPIMLTAEQVDTYNLPSLPIKDTDSRRDDWEARYGGGVELNAMFARDERLVAAREIVEDALLKYFDPELSARADDQRRELERELRHIRADILDEYAEELDELQDIHNVLISDWETLQGDFDVLVEPFRTQLPDYEARLNELNQMGATLHARIVADMAQTGLDAAELFPLPEPDVTTSTEGLLYHSRRGYWSQMGAYHQYRSNGDDSYKAEVFRLLADHEEGRS